MTAAHLLLLLAAGPGVETEISGAAVEAVDAVIESAQLTTRAKPLVHTEPKYPRFDRAHAREAWVHITYCIDESGKVQNISILDSVGNYRFDKAAVETVKQWTFEPALLNGKPVWQSRNNVLVNFDLKRKKRGASPAFVSKFRRLGRLIDNDELEAADKLFWTIYETWELSLYEVANLWSQRVRYESKIGDMYKLDLALHRATASRGEWIDKDNYINLLGAQAKVELGLGKYHEARHSYNELIETAGDDAEEVVAMRPAFEKLQAAIDSDQILTISAEVRARGGCADCDDSWNFSPVRNDFTFANINGTLKSLDMRCDNKRFESVVTELVEWHIPDSWGTCQIHIYGEPGTTFDVLMLPAAVN